MIFGNIAIQFFLKNSCYKNINIHNVEGNLIAGSLDNNLFGPSNGHLILLILLILAYFGSSYKVTEVQ